MTLRPKVLLTTLAVAALSAALMAPVAAAGGPMMGGATTVRADPATMMGSGTPVTPGPAARHGTGTMMGGTTTDPGAQPGIGTMMGMWDGSGPWGGTGMWGMMGSGMTWLRGDPAVMQAWLQLRGDHLKDMQAWYDAYKADLTSAPAQQALHELWTEHWTDMQGFYQQYCNGADWTAPAIGMWSGWQMGDMMGGGSWNPADMWGAGYGASWLMGHPAGMGQWLTLRAKQIGAMRFWTKRFGSAPSSPAARAALRTLRAQQRRQVKSFYRHHHLPTTSTWMRYGTGGWMGMGGMWGGFGW
jgi:hypothetical protein